MVVTATCAGPLPAAGGAPSNSRRLLVTSATSLAEMLVLMAPVATHGSYGTYRALTASVVRATCAGPWHSSLSMAFCVQRSLQNSSLAEESEFTDIRAAGRPRLHLVPCANMAHFSTSFCHGPRMVIGGIVQQGHTDANSGPLARAHPSRSRRNGPAVSSAAFSQYSFVIVASDGYFLERSRGVACASLSPFPSAMIVSTSAALILFAFAVETSGFSN